MDTRYFDMFEPPENVICIDLDTNSISWTPDREKINLDMLPRKALNALKTRLTQIENDIKELNAFYRQATTSLTNSGLSRAELEARVKRKRRLLELSIREAFLRFMAQMLANYKLFQRTVTRRPDMRAIDRNLTKFFDCDGFIRSKETQCQPFYRELTRTQLFYDCIMNLSFTSELEISLADSFYFFAEVCSKLGLAQSPSGVNSSHAINDDSVKLLELNESDNGQTVVVLPPSTSIGHDTNTTINSVFNYDPALCTTSFPPLRSSMPPPLLVLDESLVTPKGPENSENNTNANSAALETQSVASSSTTATTNQLKKLNALKMAGSTPIGVRAKAERLQAIRKLEAKLTVKTTPNTAAKLNEKKNMIAKTCAYSFLSNAYALWFMYLPDYIMDCDDANKNGLNYAYQVLLQMQKHSLTQPDEICFRIMMQLCLIYSFPTLAVKILLHMRKYKINISPITLSFYNKAMIETSNWPSFQQDRWARIRLTWLVVSRFKHNLRIKEARERREMKHQRRSNNKNRRRSSKSGPSSVGKKPPAVTTPKFKQPQTPQTQTNNKVVIVEVRKSSVTSSSNEQKVTETTTNKIVMSRKIDMNLDTIEIVKEMNIMNNDDDLHVNKSGILTLSAKQHDKLRGNRRHRKRRRRLRRRRSMSYSSLVEVAERIGSSSQSQINKKEAVVDNADPLSAFNTSSGERTPKRVSQSTADEIRKRLFDYKPFSSMDSFTNATATTSTKNSTAQQNNNNNSDFIYNHAKTSILTVPQKTNGETASSVSRSGDFDEDFEDEEVGGEEELEYGEEEEEREIDSDFDDDDEIDEDEEDEEDEDDDEDYEYEYEYEENKSRMSVETDRQSLPVGADEEADHKSSSANRNVTSNTTTMVFTPLQKGFKSLIKRVGSSIDANPKFTYVKDYISDKSVQIKDVIMSNTSNQQDITTKLKSMSNYQIKAGIQVPQYLNGLVKSSSQAIGLSTPKSTNESRPKSGSETEPKSRVTSHYQHHYYQQQSELAVDLEPISTSDEHFSHLRLDWWGLDKSSLFCLPHSDFDSAINDVLVDIQMTSCNLCEKCNSYLYDEEIMSGWTFNESELKLRCSNCTMYLVPNLYIKIQDYDNIRKHVKTDKTTRSPTKEETAKVAENNSNNNEETEHPFVEEDKPSPKKQQQQQQQRLSQLKMGSVELHVQYLSPFVLRKEFENIILMSKKRTNGEENGGEDMSSQSRPRIIDAAFIVEHSVIFWNLLWYFKRIGVDSGHLATILLNTRLSELRNKSKEDQQLEVSEFKFRTFVPTPTQLSNNKPASRQHPNVLIKCMWDNLKLKEEDTHHEVPLYVSWLAQHYADHVASNSKLITVLTHNELKSFRKTQANSRTLGKLYELVVRNIKESDVIVPFRNLIRERIRSKMSFSSIYRELLFLVIVALERDLIDIDAFDTEYRDAYKTLIGGEARDFIRPCDKPPNNLAVWCRRLFSPLLL